MVLILKRIVRAWLSVPNCQLSWATVELHCLSNPLEITKKKYWYLIAGINSMMCETYSSFLKRFRIFSHHTFLSACFYRSKLPASEEVSWNFQDFQATGTIWIDPKTSFMADDFFWCFFPGRNDDLNFGDFQSFVYRFDSFQDLGHSLQTLLSWSVGMFFLVNWWPHLNKMAHFHHA